MYVDKKWLLGWSSNGLQSQRLSNYTIVTLRKFLRGEIQWFPVIWWKTSSSLARIIWLDVGRTTIKEFVGVLSFLFIFKLVYWAFPNVCLFLNSYLDLVVFERINLTTSTCLRVMWLPGFEELKSSLVQLPFSITRESSGSAIHIQSPGAPINAQSLSP